MEELVPITFFMCVAMVMILRPISKRVGSLLEAMTREKLQQPAQAAAPDPQLSRITGLLEHMSRRLEIMEERLDFTERLVGSTRRGIGPAPVDDSVSALGDIRLRRETAHGLRG